MKSNTSVKKKHNSTIQYYTKSYNKSKKILLKQK